jgi:hypothetical protein
MKWGMDFGKNRPFLDSLSSIIWKGAHGWVIYAFFNKYPVSVRPGYHLKSTGID